MVVFTLLRIMSSMIILLPMNLAFSPSQSRLDIKFIAHKMVSNERISYINSDDNDDIGVGKKKRRKSTIKWITCSSTKEVTSAIKYYVKEGDTAVELGSQLRETSTALCDAVGSTGRALLVDVVRKFPKATQNKRELNRMTAMRMEGDDTDFYRDRAAFVEVDTFDSWRRVVFLRDDGDGDARIESRKANEVFTHSFPKFNVLVLDAPVISGNDMVLNCISIVKEFLAMNDVDDGNECVVIVKSSKLNSLGRKLVHGQRLFSGSKSLEGSGQMGSIIIATVGVEEYRRTIPHVVKRGDTVLEIGSHFGTTTALLHAAAEEKKGDFPLLDFHGGCLGVDIGPHIIERAQMRFPQVPFCVGDAWRTSDLIRMKERYLVGSHSVGYDVVYVDVGGLSGSEGLLEAISLLSAIENALEPRYIVIKSLCMRRLASSLVTFYQSKKREQMNLQK